MVLILKDQIVNAAIDWAVDRTHYFIPRIGQWEFIEDDEVTGNLASLISQYMEENGIER